MNELILETIRTAIFAGVLIHLWLLTRRTDTIGEPGVYTLLIAAGLLLLGMVVDVTENLPSLNRFMIVGNTDYEPLIKNGLFFLPGFLLLYAGISRLIPLVGALKQAQFNLAESHKAVESHNERLLVEIAQRRQTEEALKQSEEKYRLVVETAREMIIVVQDGKITFVNRSALDFTGLSLDESLSRHFTDLIHPEDTAMVIHNYRQRLQGKEAPPRYAFRMILPDKEIRWVEVDPVIFVWEGKPASLILATDITERIAGEKALKENRERLELALEAAELTLWDWNIPTGEVVFSKHGLGRVGYQANEIAPRLQTWERSIHRQDAASVQAAVKAMIEGTVPFLECEYRIRSKSGEYRWWLTRGKVTERNGEGHAIRATGTHLDVTYRRIAEEAIKASLAEKEVLLREIHHRVKNNLQVIASMLSIQAMYLNDDRLKGVFKESESRIRAMALVHENLYATERLSTIHAKQYVERLVSELCMGQLIGSCAPVVSSEVGDIVLELDTAVPLGLIINELFSNCLKHAFQCVGDHKVRISLKEFDPDRYELVVADNGMGLPPDLDVRRPASFGLNLVNILIDQLHGDCELDRSHGTAFRITFPHVIKRTTRR